MICQINTRSVAALLLFLAKKAVQKRSESLPDTPLVPPQLSLLPSKSYMELLDYAAASRRLAICLQTRGTVTVSPYTGRPTNKYSLHFRSEQNNARQNARNIHFLHPGKESLAATGIRNFCTAERAPTNYSKRLD